VGRARRKGGREEALLFDLSPRDRIQSTARYWKANDRTTWAERQSLKQQDDDDFKDLLIEFAALTASIF
jgi:hypothetical protein